MKKVKGFSYDIEKDKEIIEHLDNQPINNSRYILGLIKKDMEKETVKDIIKAEVEEYFSQLNLNGASSKSCTPIDQNIDQEADIDIDAINDIINM